MSDESSWHPASALGQEDELTLSDQNILPFRSKYPPRQLPAHSTALHSLVFVWYTNIMPRTSVGMSLEDRE